MLKFAIQGSDGHARAGNLELRRGIELETPVFMPVGTRASVRSLLSEDLVEMGYGLILGNTYHLHLRPGDELIKEFGGLRNFMNFPGAILTDSGGFQVFSLSKNVKFEEGGVRFRSHLDGSSVEFTPKRVIDIQTHLDSDIMMVLDDCPPYPADPKRLRESMDRTHRWAKQAYEYWQATREKYDGERPLLFGIVQGGLFEETRLESMSVLQEIGFDALAIGGLSVGEPRELFYEILNGLVPKMNRDQPHYLMGVGTIPDILEAVATGVDMFDCVLPTRNARRGQVFTSEGKKNLRNAVHSNANDPVDPNCQCKVCARYSAGYIRHLFHVGELSALRMATYHNLFFLRNFMSDMRQAILDERFTAFKRHWLNLYSE